MRRDGGRQRSARRTLDERREREIAARRVPQRVVLQFAELEPERVINRPRRHVEPNCADGDVRLERRQPLQHRDPEPRKPCIVAHLPRRQPDDVVGCERRIVPARADVAEKAGDLAAGARDDE